MLKPVFTYISKLLLFVCSGIILYSCNTINNIGLKYFPDDYVFTRADGTTYQTWNIAKDDKGFKNRTTLSLADFNKENINKYYSNIDSMTLQELRVENLKTDFEKYEYTLLSVWYGCPGTNYFDWYQYRLLVDTLSSIASNINKIAFVSASESYNFKKIKIYLEHFDYHYQSYIVPSEPYGEKCIIKTIFFLKELCPECYNQLNDDIQEYSMFLLNRHGEVIKMYEFEYEEATMKKKMIDFEKEKNELIELVK